MHWVVQPTTAFIHSFLVALHKPIANYIGGADEALLSGGGKMRLILKNRMGFVQVCVATGTPLVPCLAYQMQKCLGLEECNL